MLKPKCPFGAVMAGALVWAAGADAAAVNSAQTSVSARSRTNMDPPPLEDHNLSPELGTWGSWRSGDPFRSPDHHDAESRTLSDRRAGAGRARLGHDRSHRRAVHVN